jgi:hypothetical protein
MNPNDPAFPAAPNVSLKGLTKREYFAALAATSSPHVDANETADFAVKVADALVAKLQGNS